MKASDLYKYSEGFLPKKNERAGSEMVGTKETEKPIFPPLFDLLFVEQDNYGSLVREIKEEQPNTSQIREEIEKTMTFPEQIMAYMSIISRFLFGEIIRASENDNQESIGSKYQMFIKLNNFIISFIADNRSNLPIDDCDNIIHIFNKLYPLKNIIVSEDNSQSSETIVTQVAQFLSKHEEIYVNEIPQRDELSFSQRILNDYLLLPSVQKLQNIIEAHSVKKPLRSLLFLDKTDEYFDTLFAPESKHMRYINYLLFRFRRKYTNI